MRIEMSAIETVAGAIAMFEQLERGELVATTEPGQAPVFTHEVKPSQRGLRIKAVPNADTNWFSLKIDCAERWMPMPRWRPLAESVEPQLSPQALWGAAAELLRDASNDAARKAHKGQLTKKQLEALRWISEKQRPHQTDFLAWFTRGTLASLQAKRLIAPSRAFDYTLHLTPEGRRALVALDAS
jgi:hypothetical protein